ncbi:hypothetical protein ASE77_18805 [Sphingomonas sp. Leaf226]|nr:hypothetical protein [Sphingomonas sp. Leaf226]KQM96345.1 hypothetical protein ASE77_18805 [Sphingomonas sp. Leaf226]
MPAAPHQPTRVERVIEDADQLGRVTADRRGVPLPATRAGNPFLVQAGGDLNGGQPCGKPREDTADHRRLSFLDLQEPALDLALSIEPDHALVAVGSPSGEPPREYGGLHAAQRLVDQMLEEDRAEQAGDRKFDLVDMAFAHCM